MRNVDANGIPGCQLDIYDETGDYAFDGGDSLAIVGTILSLAEPGYSNGQWIWLYYSLRHFIRDDGVPRRHPDETKWYGQWDRCSRDQLIPLLCFFTQYRHTSLDLVFKAHRKRLFLFAWNTRRNGELKTNWKLPDLTGPDIWALWIRAKKPKWAKLVLWLLDLSLVIGAVTWRFRKDQVTRNYMLQLIISNKVLPTPFSQLASRMTNWDGLITRWAAHCEATGEYPTSRLFRSALRL